MKIYGTIGPMCSDRETLEKMIRAGMTGVRLNLSHVTISEAAPQIEALHSAARHCGKSVELLIDMQGPELRVGIMREALTLREGESVILGDNGIPVPECIRDYLKPGQQVLLDDGKILLEVRSGSSAEVLRGGILHGRKSIALPGADIYPPTMTESDLKNIEKAAEYGVSAVMQPFVRSREDLECVRRALDAAGGSNIKLFAKIENLDGAANLEELIPACDEIVIARGDLGNAVRLWELPSLQKTIARKCREHGRAFMVVTQMLTSMEHSPVPTRAEVSDIFNAVLDGCSSVMVTGETAVGDYPVETIKYLANTAAEAVKYMSGT